MQIKEMENEYLIYGLIFTLSNRIQSMGDKVYTDVTMKQHFLLITLSIFTKSPTLTEVANVMGCSYQNVKKLALQLKNKGYIDIITPDYDKRKLLIIKKDKYFLEENNNSKITLDFMEELFNQIDQESINLTFKTLFKMNNNLGGDLIYSKQDSIDKKIYKGLSREFINEKK